MAVSSIRRQRARFGCGRAGTWNTSGAGAAADRPYPSRGRVPEQPIAASRPRCWSEDGLRACGVAAGRDDEARTGAGLPGRDVQSTNSRSALWVNEEVEKKRRFGHRLLRWRLQGQPGATRVRCDFADGWR
jgi:hypothetical protein